MREPVSGIKHPAYRDALALTRGGGRQAMGRYLVEGLALVRQALALPGAPLHAVFALPERASELERDCTTREIPLYVMGAGLLTKLTGAGYETAVDAVAVLDQRTVAPAEMLGPDALILCGERIQDPRNVGVLIRTADVIGAAGLLLSADSAEPFSRQCVRSTTGSILRLPLALAGDVAGALIALKTAGARIVGSSGGAESLAAAGDLAHRPLVVVVGNEQHGISPAVAAASDAIVRLPMAPETGADSYNVTVAAGMLLYEALRCAAATTPPGT